MDNIIHLCDRREILKSYIERSSCLDFIDDAIMALEQAGCDVIFDDEPVDIVLIKACNRNLFGEGLSDF